MLKVFAFERTGSRVAGGVVIAVDAAPAFEVTSAVHVCAVAAGAAAFIVLVMMVWQVYEHVRLRKHFGGV